MNSGHYDSYWSDAYFLKIRASVNKAPKVFKAVANISRPEDIPFDVDTVDYMLDPYLRTRTFPSGCGFKTFKSLEDFRYQYRSFVAVASGAKEATEMFNRLEDDWAELTAHLSGHRGERSIIGKHEMIPIGTLARICRQQSLSPADLSARANFECLMEEVQPENASSIRAALRHLPTLKGSDRVPAHLLPDVSAELVATNRRRRVREVPEMHPEFLRLMNEYLEQKRVGEKKVNFWTEVRTIETSGVGRARVKNLRVAIQWF